MVRGKTGQGRTRKSIAERLIVQRRVTVAGCWEYTGYRMPSGYATIGAGGHCGPKVLVHRAAYVAFVGPIDENKQVCHHCDNRACFNPAHLFLGTQSDNMADMFAKGRQPTPYPRKGIKHPRAQITEDQVRRARLLLQCGNTHAEVEKLTGIPKHTVAHISTGRQWASVL